MTFDDGILKVFELVNFAEAGDKPKLKLKEKERYYFGFDSLGYNRYYTALQTNHQITAVVNVPQWGDIETLDVIMLEDEKQYTVGMVQRLVDEDGLRYTKISLERLGERYAIGS